MNRECNGDFFEVIGKRYYRCLWDGMITVNPPAKGEECQNCKRVIDGKDFGKVKAQKRTVLEAVLPNGTAYSVRESVIELPDDMVQIPP